MTIMSRLGNPDTPTWEKRVGLVGLLILLSGFSYLGWEAATKEKQPPEIKFAVEAVETLSNGFLVKVDVTNGGNQSLAALQLNARLAVGDQIEQKDAQLDYLPANSTRKIGVFFNGDPQKGELKFLPVSYQQP